MKEIILSNNMRAIVDDEDYEQLIKYNWHAKKDQGKYTTYAVCSIPRTDKTKYKDGRTRRETVRMHRMILNYPKLFVDHINGNGLDNRKSNLRLATHAENMQNSRRKNKTGYKGIRKTGNAWYARIHVDGKDISLGGYSSPIKAAQAYDKAARHYFGNFARCNFS